MSHGIIVQIRERTAAMAAEGKFAHISVSSDDEDDFVIQTGVPATASEVWDDGEGDAGSDRAYAASVEVPAAPAQSGCVSEVVRDPASLCAGGEFAEAKSSSPGSAGSAGSADRSYRETTLEDLESTPMSTMQKGVIVAAVLAIVAFVVWYVVLR